MNGYMIYDGKGYFVKRRRVDGREINLWSPKKKDAALFHFREVALRIASTITFKVQVLSCGDKSSG